METNGNTGEVRYTIKEILQRIDAKVDMLVTQMQNKADVGQLNAVSGRVDTLERDMQEGKETVKTMLIPDYQAYKQSADRIHAELFQRLDHIEKDPIWVTRQNSRPRFEALIQEVAQLREQSASQSAVDRYKKWVLVTAVPALLGAAYAIAKLIELIRF